MPPHLNLELLNDKEWYGMVASLPVVLMLATINKRVVVTIAHT